MDRLHTDILSIIFELALDYTNLDSIRSIYKISKLSKKLYSILHKNSRLWQDLYKNYISVANTNNYVHSYYQARKVLNNYKYALQKFQVSCIFGYDQQLKMLLNDIKSNYKVIYNFIQLNSLSAAINNNHLQVVKILIEDCANTNNIKLIKSDKNVDMVNYLLSKNISINFINDNYDNKTYNYQPILLVSLVLAGVWGYVYYLNKK
jgi:hypothetical protein